MLQKKSIIGAAAFFLVAALFVGYFALAADIGGKENPLVTLDYLKSLDPQIDATIEEIASNKVNAFMEGFNQQLAQAYEHFDSVIAGGGGSGDLSSLINDEEFVNSVAAEVANLIGSSASSGEGGSGYAKVVVEADKTLHLKMGSKILLRLGSGTVVASNSPGLIDTTDASKLENGEALKENHEYLVTMEAGRDIKCTAKMTVFVLGAYTIS